MINLIGNEFTKIFKKKTIYILFILIIGYILLMNIMMKATDDGYSYYFYDEWNVEFYESSLRDLDPNDPADRAQYIDYKTQLDLQNLSKEYGNRSWQVFIINNELTQYISTINAYEYSDEITEEAYNEAKQAYDNALEKLESDDWKYFVNADLAEINASLEEQNALKETTEDTATLATINNTIKDLELQKQINEWRLEKNISYAPSFLNNALDSYYSNMTQLNSFGNVENLDDEEYQYYQSALEQSSLNRYYIENNISLETDNREIFINFFNQYELFILIVGIVIAGSIVSDEFNKGTIKLLLVKPYNRVKILLAKLIVSICMIIIAIVVIAIEQLLIGGIVFGFDSLSTPAIVYNFDINQVETLNLFTYVALIGIGKLPIYILLTTLAFACSTIFTSTALAVAVPFLGYIGSSIINQLALVYNVKQVIYFVTPNWDLTQYLFGGTPLFKELTLPFSIGICLVYFLIMVVVSCIVFKKRDIKNI